MFKMFLATTCYFITYVFFALKGLKSYNFGAKIKVHGVIAYAPICLYFSQCALSHAACFLARGGNFSHVTSACFRNQLAQSRHNPFMLKKMHNLPLNVIWLIFTYRRDYKYENLVPVKSSLKSINCISLCEGNARKDMVVQQQPTHSTVMNCFCVFIPATSKNWSHPCTVRPKICGKQILEKCQLLLSSALETAPNLEIN